MGIFNFLSTGGLNRKTGSEEPLSVDENGVLETKLTGSNAYFRELADNVIIPPGESLTLTDNYEFFDGGFNYINFLARRLNGGPTGIKIVITWSAKGAFEGELGGTDTVTETLIEDLPFHYAVRIPIMSPRFRIRIENNSGNEMTLSAAMNLTY